MHLMISNKDASNRDRCIVFLNVFTAGTCLMSTPHRWLADGPLSLYLYPLWCRFVPYIMYHRCVIILHVTLHVVQNQL